MTRQAQKTSVICCAGNEPLHFTQEKKIITESRIICGGKLRSHRPGLLCPPEVLPEACEKGHAGRCVKAERRKCFGCACCPEEPDKCPVRRLRTGHLSALNAAPEPGSSAFVP